MRLHKYIVWIILVCLVSLTGYITVAAQVEPSVNFGDFRVINALLGLGDVDVYLDGTRIAYGLSPESATPYFRLIAGQHHLAVRQAGIVPDTPPITDLLFTLAGNQSLSGIVYQTQFATAEYSPPVAQSGSVLWLDDDRSPIQLGKTRLTAVHLALGTPQQISIAYPSRASLLHELPLEQRTGSIDIDAGERTLVVVDADSPDLDLLARSGTFSFYSSTLYTLIIVPYVNPISAGDDVVGQLSGEPYIFAVSAPIDPPDDGIRLRIIHAAHDTAVVDVYIDERLVAQRVFYSRFTEYLGVESYSHTISLRRFGASPSSPPLAQANFIVSDENRNQVNWTLLLLNTGDDNIAALEVIQPELGLVGQQIRGNTFINTPGGQMVMVLLPDDISQTQRQFSRIRLIHALDGLPSVSLFSLAEPLLDPPPGTTATPSPVPETPTAQPIQTELLTNPALFGTEASSQDILAGLYPQIAIQVPGSGNSLEVMNNVQLVNGLVYTYVVVGSTTGNPPLQVLTFSEFGTGISREREYTGIIVGSVVNVRSRPSDNSSILTTLNRDMIVEILGRNQNADWVRIRFADPVTGSLRLGWLFGTLLDVQRLGLNINILSLPVTQ